MRGGNQVWGPCTERKTQYESCGSVPEAIPPSGREAVIKSAASAASPEGFQAVIKSAASAASPAAQKTLKKSRKNSLFGPFSSADFGFQPSGIHVYACFVHSRWSRFADLITGEAALAASTQILQVVQSTCVHGGCASTRLRAFQSFSPMLVLHWRIDILGSPELWATGEA